MYGEKFFRNRPALTPAMQSKVGECRFCICGLGGVGGFALESLVRLGAESIILFDHDRFELTNYNRQLLATDDTLDRPKVDVAAKRARSINKKAKVAKYSRFDAKKISRADILIDATDNLSTKMEIADSCRKRGIPYVFCSAKGTRGIVSVFTRYGFRKAFQVDGKKLESSPCSSILCPAAALAGTLAANQAMNKIIGKPVVHAPEALFFDMFDKRVFWRTRLG
jgi:sulfur carrier protein ThiS adenylyltransferase